MRKTLRDAIPKEIQEGVCKLIEDILPYSKPHLMHFDMGNKLGAAWTLPSGCRTGAEIYWGTGKRKFQPEYITWMVRVSLARDIERIRKVLSGKQIQMIARMKKGGF